LLFSYLRSESIPKEVRRSWIALFDILRLHRNLIQPIRDFAGLIQKGMRE